MRLARADAWERRPIGGRRVKRAVDVVGACGGLLVLSPLLGALALLVRLDSSGPALYRQERVGRGGRRFTMYKFRTMTAGSDTTVHRDYVRRYMTGSGDGLRNGSGRYKLEGDARVTRVGRLLRRWSLDELPQLLNVALGDMSLVGPRPPLPYEVELYTPRHSRRLDVLPGITGLWQVSGRSDVAYEERVRLDMFYIRNYSIWLDLQLILQTLPVVLGGRGAY